MLKLNEIKEMSNVALIMKFECIVITMTHEANSTRGISKKTQKNYERLLSEMGIRFNFNTEEYNVG